MWHSMAIDGVTLIEALRCWEGSKVTTNRPRQMAVATSPWEDNSYEVSDKIHVVLMNFFNLFMNNVLKYKSGTQMFISNLCDDQITC